LLSYFRLLSQTCHQVRIGVSFMSRYKYDSKIGCLVSSEIHDWADLTRYTTLQCDRKKQRNHRNMRSRDWVRNTVDCQLTQMNGALQWPPHLCWYGNNVIINNTVKSADRPPHLCWYGNNVIINKTVKSADRPPHLCWYGDNVLVNKTVTSADKLPHFTRPSFFFGYSTLFYTLPCFQCTLPFLLS
jgi:hypothetical protein